MLPSLEIRKELEEISKDRIKANSRNKGALQLIRRIPGNQYPLEVQEGLPVHLLRRLAGVEPECLKNSRGYFWGDPSEQREFLLDEVHENTTFLQVLQVRTNKDCLPVSDLIFGFMKLRS